MKRNLCGLQPVFDLSLQPGTKVKVVDRNRKMEILFQGVGLITQNDKTSMWIQVDTEYNFKHVFVSAKDVYHGKVNLEVLEEDFKCIE